MREKTIKTLVEVLRKQNKQISEIKKEISLIEKNEGISKVGGAVLCATRRTNYLVRRLKRLEKDTKTICYAIDLVKKEG